MQAMKDNFLKAIGLAFAIGIGFVLFYPVTLIIKMIDKNTTNKLNRKRKY